jgi:hypothetical protein
MPDTGGAAQLAPQKNPPARPAGFLSLGKQIG